MTTRGWWAVREVMRTCDNHLSQTPPKPSPNVGVIAARGTSHARRRQTCGAPEVSVLEGPGAFWRRRQNAREGLLHGHDAPATPHRRSVRSVLGCRGGEDGAVQPGLRRLRTHLGT